MLDLVDIAVVAGMMLLRIGLPALVILAIGYGLKRLDRRWEAEARAEQGKAAIEQPQAPQPRPAAPQPGRKPGKQPSVPQPLPFIPPQPIVKEQRQGLYAQPGMTAQPGVTATAKHCWEEKGCSESKKAACAAPANADQPCWQARFNAEGHIPEECVSCDVFQRYPTM